MSGATIHKLKPAVQTGDLEDQINRIGKSVGALLDAQKYAECFDIARLVLDLAPGDWRGHFWCGLALRSMTEYDAAEAAFRASLDIKPNNTVVKANLGSLIFDLDPRGEGLELLRSALEEDPSAIFTAQNYMCSVLSSGDYAAGWQLYARRGRFPNVGGQICKYHGAPFWDGRSKGRVLLVGEEGIGERIMFASMVRDVLKTGATPLIEVTSGFERFAPWFQRSFPNIDIVKGGELASIDYQTVIGDLGQFFRPNKEAFPKENAYMSWDRERAAAYRARLGGDSRPIIGVSWKSLGTGAGPWKSLKLHQLTSMLNLRGAVFVDLQYLGSDVERNTAAPFMAHLPDVDLVNDSDGTAALIGACDLVVTVSSVTAHMAGAMGKPVYLLCPSRMGRMWFWGTEGESCDWYPSMRIFRQTRRPQAWEPAIEHMTAAVKTFVEAHHGHS